MAGVAPGTPVPQRCSSSAELVSAFRQLTNRLENVHLDSTAFGAAPRISYPWSCAAQRVAFLSSCACRSDTPKPVDPWLLRPIRSTRLERTVAEETAVFVMSSRQDAPCSGCG